MLYFSRWKALATILTALVVCLFAVPNFFPEATVKNWPKWAQRHVVLGLDLQGGSYLLLEVDGNSVKRDRLNAVRDDVRKVLRDARILYTGLTTTRGDAVEVRITKETDVPAALTKLREISQPLGGLLSGTGQRDLEVSDAGGGLIRLTIPQPAMLDRMRKTIEQSIQIVERRVNELGTVEPLIQRQGTDRILVQVPGLQDPTRLKELLGKTAKMEFRMVDLTVSPEQATTRGSVPADSELLPIAPKTPARNTSSRSRCWYPAAISPTRSPASTSAAPASRSCPSSSTPRARANSLRRPPSTSRSRLRSCSTAR